MSLTEILKNRTNVSFFRNDRIPEKKLIQEILSQAHELTPHKNNFWHLFLLKGKDAVTSLHMQIRSLKYF